MHQVSADPRITRRHAVGTAAHPQPSDYFCAAVAAVRVLARITFKTKVLSKEPVAAAHGRLADVQHLAGLNGGAAQFQQIKQAYVLQQRRELVGLHLAEDRIGMGGHEP